MKRSEKPWERENVENFFVVDIENNVLKIPKPKHDGEFKGFAIGGGIGGGIAAICGGIAAICGGSGRNIRVRFRRKTSKFAESARF